MQKQIYRLNEVGGSGVLEIEVVGTNDVEPYCITRTVACTFLKGDDQIDFDIDEQDLASLINYLSNVKEYIDGFNIEAKKSAKKE